MKTSGRIKIDLIHKAPRLIGTNSIQIKVIVTQDKKPKIKLLGST